MDRLKYTHWIKTKWLGMMLQITSRNSATTFAHHFNSRNYHTYWQEYEVNFVISAVFCIRTTLENREVKFT